MKQFDAKIITELVDTYMQAVYNGDIETLQTIFYGDAAMYGYLNGYGVMATPQVFYDDINSKPTMKENGDDCQYVITHLQVEGNIASVCMQVEGFYGEATVIDMFHLMKIEGVWKITCKTFSQR
ncbi:hypothetical protein A4S06_02315 [Erysipelotrichaceae bacterium MTC7]|nr:hypothetical protein A4S06_02315 [Erysipelotrichaceae bacterium MTC7]